MHRSWLALLLVVVASVLVPRLAAADTSAAHSVAVAVLAFDSDDAEEQADALTGALRSRVRASQGWSLVETSQALGMLTAALRCPGKPVSADCQQRISDQIKAERYMYGWVSKGPASQVTAEVHLFQKGKPDTTIKEVYADNLKDQNDDALRKIAQRVLDKLGGTAVGAVVVNAGSDGGEVVVDGDKRVPLANGRARIELAPGTHSIEVAVAGQPSQKRNVLVNAGKESAIEIAVAAPKAPEVARKPAKSFPTRKVIGAALAVGGAVAVTFSVINFSAYATDIDDGKAYANQPVDNPKDPKLPAGKAPDDVCGKVEGYDTTHSTICAKDADAKRHSTIGWITAGGGVALIGAGVLLYVTDSSGTSSDRAAKKTRRPQLLPAIGQGSGGVVLSGTF